MTQDTDWIAEARDSIEQIDGDTSYEGRISLHSRASAEATIAVAVELRRIADMMAISYEPKTTEIPMGW